GHVPWGDCGTGRDRDLVRRADPPLHRGVVEGRAGTGPGAPVGDRRRARRVAEPAGFAVRLPIPSALPLRDGALPRGETAVRRTRPSSFRSVSSRKWCAGIDRPGPVRRADPRPHRRSEMSLEPLRERVGAINDLLTTVNLLVWDSRTMMPSGAVSVRGRQIATLTRLARDLACDDDMMRRLEAAEREVA